MEQQPMNLGFLRKKSPSTGLSYLCNRSNSTNPQRLYVFLHGWACAATDYLPLFTALSSLDQKEDSTSLYVALDLPGRGGTSQTTCPDPTVPAFAALINSCRAEISSEYSDDGLLETFLVGHSMGCRMALEAFSQQPTNVNGIILIDGSWAGRQAELHATPVVEDVDAELKRISDRIIMQSMYGPHTPEAFKQEVEQRLSSLDLEYEYKLSHNYICWDVDRMEAVLEEIGQSSSETRVLILQSTEGRGAKRRALKRGEEGNWLPFVRGKVGNRIFESDVVEDCGHWPHVDKAGGVAAIIRRFEETRCV